MRFSDVDAQYRRYEPELQARFRAVFAHGAFILGPEVKELEAALARYVGVEHAITVASGTQSLELALRALRVGPGDEVITVSFTFIGTVDPIRWVGATPVFVDIDPATFNLDVSQLERAIGPRTRAILPVSLFGGMPDYAAIEAIAARHGLPVIEDGAQSFGATRRGQKSGSVTRVGSTSFFPTKPLGCYGDGGALFTNDSELAARLRALRSHGRSGAEEPTELGTNSRLDTLQAAALLVKLPYLEEELAARAQVAQRYDDALRHAVVVPEAPADGRHVYAQYTIRAPGRDRLAARLKERSIPTAVYYPKCAHQLAPFQGAPHHGLPESERAAREVISLPMHAYLSEADQTRVVSAVLESLRQP